ncbi:3-beta-hydroxysteroid dehydrogenase [Lophium mytilinum]|uniref:3-beta-hydroxysteroid dehydrogenase n=1 Tax=Lophium mytilinum TaxID=390894 RepID=A0A6A6QKF7_9PEZI|nr:3-beta-hydroxysteroid dehydrogenase [Lophium mytilinum]
MTNKVALITGGASGMGLAVAQALAKRGNWTLHLVDLNAEAGAKAAADLPNAHFHKTNVTSYSSLASTFEAAFKISGSIDFVFANAGIVERDDFYAKSDLAIPPEPNQLSIDINLKSVVNTSYLALHFFRKSPHKGKDGVLIATASCGGLYPSEFCPMYSAAKAGVIHFIRSIAYSYHANDGVRTYAICPGTVRTGLMTGEEWKSFPEEYFTPISTIVSSVTALVDGGALEDAFGVKLPAEKAYSLIVEINGQNHYFRNQVPFCDDQMASVMAKTSMEAQAARIHGTK